MSHYFGILMTIVSIVTTIKALPGIHKQMSPHQLQSIFQVDNIEAVPHYEVVQLLHHNTEDGIASADAASSQPHYRRRRSINNSVAESSPKESHHVKKDLSKNPYYSELKAAALNADTANSVHANKAKSYGSLKELKEHNVSFNAFGENLNLTLRPTEGLFKGGSPHTLRMWTVNSEANTTHGLDMKEVADEEAQSSEHIGEVFQDEANMAAILMRRHMETGDLIMEGSIGHEMVIKPLPHDLSPNKAEVHHVIYKREVSSMDHLSDFAFMEPDDLEASEKLEKLQRRQRRAATLADFETRQTGEEALEDNADIEADEIAEATRTNFKRAKRQAPYMIYPEVLVIVDYDGYRLHGGDNLQVKRYFISFWNGVDLRYRLLKGPRIRISIAGIIISRGRDATPYLERNRVGRDAIDSAAALTDMGKYLFRERRLPVYDIAVAITKYDMCRRRKGGRCTKGTAGFAYVGGACVVNKRLEKVNSVAIIEDTGGFSGIIVAAHEVGHLLGAVHDGSPPPSYLGGPGAQRCRWEDGYIMSDLRHTERGFRWSPCTVQSFHHFLNGDTATCLHNAPHEDGALGRSLPGSLLSLDAQCRRDRGTYACFKDERVCAQLFCFDSQTGYCVAYRPAAEGSACGNGLHCLDGRCTPLPSNVIPDYRLVYNNADAAKSAGNFENSSSEEETDDDDDNEDGEDENSSEEENSVQTSNNNLQKIDNSVEETSLEVTDDDNETKSTTAGKIPFTKSTTATITTETPTLKQQQYTINTQTPSTQTDTKYNTFEYLAKILENNKQWQHLLSRTTITTANPTTTTTTTTTPTTTKTSTKTTTPKSITDLQQIQQLQQQHGGGVVVVKTSTSSSVSSSSSSSSSSKSGSINSGNRKLFNDESDNNSSSNNEIINKNKIQPNKQQTHTHLEQYQPQSQSQQQHKQQQQQPQQLQPNFLQVYSTEFRKQFQYYLNLLQKNSSNFLNRNLNNNVKIQKTKSTTTNTKQELSTNISNYSATSNHHHKNNNGNTGNNNSNDNDDDEIDDDDDDNEESNETIDKQKRKFDVHFTTATMHEPQQLQQQQSPPPTTTTPTINTVTATPTRSYVFGGRSTAGRTHSFFDTYFKKLQALQQQQQQNTASASPSSTTSVSTTTSVSSSTSAKTAAVATATAKSAADQQQQQQPNGEQQFGSHFLKRTQSSSSSSGSSSSGKSSRNNNHNTKNSSSINNNNNNNNNKHKNEEDDGQQQQYTNAAAASAALTMESTTQQQPAYVTNYIGDNTNNLAAVVQQQQRQQQQQLQQQQHISSPLPSPQQQQQQSSQSQSQQQKQKIKHQKLIRRQLRTQQQQIKK